MWYLVVVVVLLLVVIVAAAIVSALLYFTPYNVEIANKKFQITLKPTYVEQQKLLFVAFTSWLHKEHILYWATQHTLVGAAHGALFEHDALSIAVPHDHDRQLYQNVGTSKGANQQFVLRETKEGYTCHLNTGDFPYVAIDIVARRNHEFVPCSSRDAIGECMHNDSHQRRHEIYLVTDIFPLQSIVVNTVTVNVPKKFLECAALFSAHNTRQTWLMRLLMNQPTKTIFSNATSALH